MQSENTSLSTEWCGKNSRVTAASSFACAMAFEWNTMRLQEPKNENKTSLEKSIMQKCHGLFGNDSVLLDAMHF